MPVAARCVRERVTRGGGRREGLSIGAVGHEARLRRSGEFVHVPDGRKRGQSALCTVTVGRS